jgi:hypothetical protein
VAGVTALNAYSPWSLVIVGRLSLVAIVGNRQLGALDGGATGVENSAAQRALKRLGKRQTGNEKNGNE